MEPISNPNQIHFVAPVTLSQLAEVRDALKAGHPPGTSVDLVLEDAETVRVEVLVPDQEPWRARFGVPLYEAVLPRDP